MRIGIDARLYGTKHGGIGRYAAELIKNLETQDNNDEYVIFLSKENFNEYIPINQKFRKVSADFKVYGVFEQLLFPFLLYKHDLDLVHFIHFNAPLLYRKKFILTIHDLIISHYPSSRATTLNPLLYEFKLKAYDYLVKAVAKKAQKIIAVSQFTKSDIVKFLGVPAAKVSVIYEGVDLPQANDSAASSDALGLSGDFLLYVGSAYPHKNLELLLDAFADVAKKQPDIKLVLVGRNNYFYERLKEYARKLLDQEVLDRVIFAGYLSDAAVIELYKSAKLYVFPSLLEGFGLPPLEAQAFGLPVASSNKSCLPEILGDSALYFDPEDILDMAAKIKTGLSDDSLRRQLIGRGFANVKRFSWAKMAKEILELYHS